MLILDNFKVTISKTQNYKPSDYLVAFSTLSGQKMAEYYASTLLGIKRGVGLTVFNGGQITADEVRMVQSYICGYAHRDLP